jgi:hypothetical protein
VQGNFIGTDATGTITDPNGVPGSGDELGNRRFGVFTCDGPSCGSIVNITIGGTAAGARNIISGNGADGVVLGNAAENAGHLVQGNYIGTDVTGRLARGNASNGVWDVSSGSLIGGTAEGARNVISANGANGVQLQPANSRVEGNFIGLQADGVAPLGNAQNGVLALGFGSSLPSTVGGTLAGSGNRIAFNGGDGVRVSGFGRRSAILGNSIYSNNLLGIELTDDANNNQAAPVLISTTLSGGNATITGTLTSAANTIFRLEFFANHVCDPSGRGEGQTLIGVTSATTDAGGVANFAPTLPLSVQRGNFLTATATDPNGNTSEFSLCFRTAAKRFDFDGDGQTDISIFRPSAGQWWYLRSSDAVNRVFQFGNSSDRIVPADYTGDGRADIAVWRPSTGQWFILRSEDASFYAFPFGLSEDIPAPADFDGDGRADPAVFRPSTGTWFISRSTGGTTILQFGLDGDLPVVADYDGDGRADIAIYRPSGGEWWYLRSSDGESRVFQFGASSDKPVPADYTGDGRADIAFWRPSNGEWFVLRSENLSYFTIPFGLSGDIPVPGDYDGDGRTDFAVWRAADTNWYLLRSTSGFIVAQFGAAGDKPVPSAFVP